MSASDADVAKLARFVAEIGSEAPGVVAPVDPTQGLRGEYYAGRVPGRGAVLLTRNEAVELNLGLDAPGAGVPADEFSARWSGVVTASATGAHVFQTLSDDGVRLWVDGRLVIDNWTDHGVTADTTVPIAMVAGERYAIRLEYYERGGGALVMLRWQPPGAGGFATIPAASLAPVQETARGLKGEYYGGLIPGQGPVLLTRNEAVDYELGLAAPGAGVTADLYAARWSGAVVAEATGDHVFQTRSDDGVRLWIDGRLVIDNWTDHGETADSTVPIAMVAGRRYTVQLEYYERGGGSTLRLRWRRPGDAGFGPIQLASLVPQGAAVTDTLPVADASVGLKGEYYAGVVPGVGEVLLTRTEAVELNLGLDAPGPGVPADNFSARWSGTVMADATGSFAFQTLSDDGVRLWVDGHLVIDNWTDHGVTADTTAPIAMIAGQRYAIRLEYYERGGGALVMLRWLRPGRGRSRRSRRRRSARWRRRRGSRGSTTAGWCRARGRCC